MPRTCSNAKLLTFEPSMSRIIKLELFWILLAVGLAVLVVIPIALKTTYYPFYIDNILFVFVFITLLRLMLFTGSSMLALHSYVKLFFILISATAIFILIDRFYNFRAYIDNFGSVPFLGHLPDKEQMNMENYVNNEMVFFGIGAIALAIIFPFYLVRSIWMWRNKGRHF